MHVYGVHEISLQRHERISKITVNRCREFDSNKLMNGQLYSL